MISAVLGLLLISGCSSGSGNSRPDATGKNAQARKTAPATTAGGATGSSTGKTGAGFSGVAAGTEPVPAFEWLPKAGRLAAGWHKDAKLYAIATPVLKVDKKGRAPAWLYTYVSPSAGAVKSILVDGGKVRSLPQQTVPKQSVDLLERKALPASGKLLNSTGAMKKSDRVRRFLERHPKAKASAGLDSTSTPEPTWFLATVNGTKRIEERIPATSGGS